MLVGVITRWNAQTNANARHFPSSVPYDDLLNPILEQTTLPGELLEIRSHDRMGTDPDLLCRTFHGWSALLLLSRRNKTVCQLQNGRVWEHVIWHAWVKSTCKSHKTKNPQRLYGVRYNPRYSSNIPHDRRHRIFIRYIPILLGVCIANRSLPKAEMHYIDRTHCQVLQLSPGNLDFRQNDDWFH
jgi:hypothetical protein